MQPDRDIEYIRECLAPGIEAAPLVPLFLPIQPVRDATPFYRVDCALRKRDGSLISSAFIRTVAGRQSAFRARSGELECWLLDRCLQLATELKAAGRPDRLCFWLTPGSGYDVLVARLLSLASPDSPVPVAVGIRSSFHVTSDACAAVSLAARGAGMKVLVGCYELADCDGRALAELCPAFVEVPAESLLSVTAHQASDWIERLHARGTEVIAVGIESSQQLVRLLDAGIDYFSGRFFASEATDMSFDFGG